METDLLLRLGLALAIGLIVGVERGWRERDVRSGGRAAGVRTFALVGLFGGVAGELALVFGSTALIEIFLLALIAPFAWFSWREQEAEGAVSVTSVVAAAVVFGLGALAAGGRLEAAAAGGVVTAGVLASRESLHGLVARMTWLELRAFLLLLAMTVVVMPLLPERAVDLYGAVNPRELWLLTVLTAGVSFAGYVATKALGPEKGPALAGLVGGLVSSTAVAIAFARRSKAEAAATGPLAAGAALAAGVSAVRATGLAAVVNPALLPHLAPAAAAAALAFCAPEAVRRLRRVKAATTEPALDRPFELGPVLLFGVLLTGIALAGGWAVRTFHEPGLYALAAISGFADVDAVTLSTARMSRVGLAEPAAVGAILLALGSNAVQRVVYAALFGSRAFALHLGLATGLAFLAAAIAYVGAGLVLP
ncbi:MAG TPA: MgtC/SapB family protein [Caulobacteraceae bacterium]|jgi:uncharacterized membrane protein (DUF4010 family)|nr:MgtC/SapB family protein [Caulobacteraceae bacterium]